MWQNGLANCKKLVSGYRLTALKKLSTLDLSLPPTRLNADPARNFLDFRELFFTLCLYDSYRRSPLEFLNYFLNDLGEAKLPARANPNPMLCTVCDCFDLNASSRYEGKNHAAAQRQTLTLTLAGLDSVFRRDRRNARSPRPGKIGAALFFSPILPGRPDLSTGCANISWWHAQNPVPQQYLAPGGCGELKYKPAGHSERLA